MPLRQQKYKKHILGCFTKTRFANKKAKNMRPAAINTDKIYYAVTFYYQPMLLYAAQDTIGGRLVYGRSGARVAREWLIDH